MANPQTAHDVELGLTGSDSVLPLYSFWRVTTNRIKTLHLWIKKHYSMGLRELERDDISLAYIEDFPNGYPRLSALMASHDSFHVFRRFSRLRVRVVLLAQDKLTQLEKDIDRIDNDETSPLFLACSRRDRSVARQSLISEAKEALATYDALLQNFRHVKSLEYPQPRHIQSIINWLRGNGCLAREEAEFLNHKEELLVISAQEDALTQWLTHLVFVKLLGLRKRSSPYASRDRHVHIFPRSLTEKTVRIALVPIIVMLLSLPIVLCQYTGNLVARLAIVIAAISTFTTVLTLLTRSKTIELAVAAATYSAVLIAFITGTP